MEMTKEDFYTFIDGYDNRYAINYAGEVISFSRLQWNGYKFWQSKEKVLTNHLMKNGYYSVGLTKNCKTTLRYIHRLIAELFIPNPNNYSCINHKDGNKLNNSLDNLEWCTRGQNIKHAFRTGLMPTGERHYNAKITDSEVYHIRSFKGIRNGKELGDKFGLSSAQISRIKNNKERN